MVDDVVHAWYFNMYVFGTTMFINYEFDQTLVLGHWVFERVFHWARWHIQGEGKKIQFQLFIGGVVWYGGMWAQIGAHMCS